MLDRLGSACLHSSAMNRRYICLLMLLLMSLQSVSAVAADTARDMDRPVAAAADSNGCCGDCCNDACTSAAACALYCAAQTVADFAPVDFFSIPANPQARLSVHPSSASDTPPLKPPPIS